VVEQPIDRLGLIDTLINSTRLFVSKPFTEYTLDDYWHSGF
jgi:hypothetical protein